ncbi:MAG: ACP S-malonyltransferase [Eubacterium sp.]
MGKIAFVFSGQGDQFPGMGKELYENHMVAADVFNMCEKLRPGTLSQCFSGTSEELKETKNTQPCLFAMELAATAILNEAGIKPDAVAGFSLGEVVAAVAAGIFTPETGFRLVCKRGEYMQKAAEKHDTSMAAIVKLTREQVEELCGKYQDIYPVNYNCPGQITVSGLSKQMPEFFESVRESGGRAIPLKVKGAFHSPFMNEASEAFEECLLGEELNKGKITLYSNVTANPYSDNIAELLSKQISSPVQWEKIINNMINTGIDTFIEIGPGRTLTNITRKINTEVKTYSVSELSTILSEVKAC